MFRFSDLSRVIPGSTILGDKYKEWKNISIDSRSIKRGNLFFAIRGEKYDGHQFIKDACKKGASGVILEKMFFRNHQLLFEEYKKPFLLVDDSLVALQLWAHYYHSLFKPLNICITGSNGKTTTKEMIAHLLISKYHVLKSQGNYNNEIGVPLTLLNLAPHHDVLVIEMAAQKLGEIKELTDIVKPDISVITNIGEAHVGLFGSTDNIAREKSEIILALKDKGTVVLNRDDCYFDYLRNCVSHHHEIMSFGFHPEAKLRAMNCNQEKQKGIYFDILFEGRKYDQLLIPMIGRFNVQNALAALAVGIKMHIPIDELIQSITRFKGINCRMERLVLNRGITLILDYYNANPTAVREVLSSVKRISTKRYKIAVLGDMLELGKYTADYHKAIGTFIASLSFDMLIGFGEYARYIIQGAQDQGMDKDKTFYFDREEKEKMMNHLMKIAPDDSMILLKGSRNMQMEDIVHYWKVNEKVKGKDGHE